MPGGLAWLALPCLALLALPGAPLAALLLLGLAAEGLSHGLAGQMLLVPVLAAEAWATAALTTLCGTPAEPSGAAVLLPQGRVLLLLRACSAFSLFWPTMLATLALPALLSGAVRPGWRAPLLALAVMLVLNLLRLLAMALSPDAHAFLHAPAGELLEEVAFALPPLLALLPVRPCNAGR
jgi:exosortase/archaeosortase family protein